MLDNLKKIRLLIADNEIKAAFKLSQSVLSQHPNYVNISKLFTQFKEVDEKYDLSEIDFDDYLVNKNKIVNSFMKTIGNIQEDIEAQANTAISDKELLQEILHLLSLSYEGFLTQIKVRDKLVESIYLRTKDTPTTQYWEYFYQHYNSMTPIEKILHQRIRSYTIDLIGKYNFKVLNILEANPQLLILLPYLKELLIHLSIWKTMYENEFLHNEGMSLVYLRELDKQFPPGVERKIKSIVDKL